MAKAAETIKKSRSEEGKKTGRSEKERAENSVGKKEAVSKSFMRYKCRICGYVYSPLRGEPHNGIPAGTAF